MAANRGPQGLRVFDLTLSLGRRIDVVLRQTRCYASLADQLRRAAYSILLNISEGAAHTIPGRKRYHYEIADASTGECIGALNRLRARYSHADVQSLERDATMISVMLMALARSVERQQPPRPPDPSYQTPYFKRRPCKRPSLKLRP